MKNKGLLFSLLAVGSFTATSCSGSGLRHTVSKDNKVYHADLNFNGKIDPNEENLTWVESYDALLKKANSITDLNKAVEAFNINPDDEYATAIARYEILHEAEELIMSTGAVLPLCNYIDPYLLKEGVKGIYTNSLGFKFLDQLTTNDKPGLDYAITVGTKAETFDPANNSDASTSIALFQIMAGAKRYVNSGKEQEGEEGKGVYKAEIEDGVCKVTKKLVYTEKSGEETHKNDDDWILFDNCPDLMDEMTTIAGEDEDKQQEIRDKYEGTARYTIELKSDAVWNDGSAMTIDDFIYAWTRASSATYNGQPFGMWCQLFDSIRGYNVWNTIGQQTTADPTKWDEDTQAKWNNTDPNKGTVLTDADKYQYKAKFEGITNINGTGCAGGMAGIIRDNDKQMTVQLVNDCSYFDELLAFTAYMPVKKEKVLIKKDKDGKPVEDETKAICTESPDWWMNKDKSYLTNGPMQINGPIRNQDSGGIDLVQAEHATPGFVNEKTIKSLKFLFIDKDSTMYDAYRTGSVVLTNNFPIALIDQ
ncbi:MAG: hypothetical protein MJ208_04120, partial [Bacilli bacterium]|nr:hypothetical protein [Bacilli bacterium]